MPSTMDFIVSTLNIAIDKHGSGIVLSVIEGLVKSHAAHLEVAPHGMFIKMHFENAKKAQPSSKMETNDINTTRSGEIQSPPPGLSAGEPEVEASPSKTDDNSSAHKLSNQMCDQLEPQGPAHQAEHIFQQVLEEAERLQITNDNAKFTELLDQKFNDLFENLPKRPFTELKRDQFEKKYNNMHRESFWKRMCRKHFNETGDPLAKSDAVLEVANVIHQHLRTRVDAPSVPS